MTSRKETNRIECEIIKIVTEHGQAVGDLVGLLCPVVKRITADQLPVFLKRLGDGNGDDAMALLYSRMTGKELVAVKKKLVGRLEAAAAANAETKTIVNKFIVGSMKLALGVALAGVGL